jgi:hypothetical protein
MAIKITEFRKFEKNTLKGFATVFLTGAGLQIKDCTVHQDHGKRWISLPAKPYKDEEGNTKYSYIVSFPDKGIYSKFQEQALKALDEHLALNKEPQPSSDEIPF